MTRAILLISVLGCLGTGTVFASDPSIYGGAGANPASIQTIVDSFRSDLGPLNPNDPGTFGSGRREINWDAVPDGSAAPNLLPADFFNGAASPRARGVVFGTAGSGFEVSADGNNPTSTPKDFADINASYLSEFEAFSPERLFTVLGNNTMEVTFFIPGSTTPATTRGFGAVFSDVDLDTSASLTFYDPNGTLLIGVTVPAAGPASATFSFLGLAWTNPVVSRVVIKSGALALSSSVVDDPAKGDDLVVMDDFIYGEPVPEAASCGLLLALAAFLQRPR